MISAFKLKGTAQPASMINKFRVYKAANGD